MKKICQYPKIVVTVIALITILLGSNLRNVKIDNDTEKFLPDSHAQRAALDKAEEVFGSLKSMSVGIEVKRESVFTVDTLGVIDTLTKEFEMLDGVHRVQSITNSDYIEGVDGSIIVAPLVEDFTGSADDVSKLREKVLSWDIYQDLFISDDFKSSQILVTTDTDMDPDEQKKLYFELKELTEELDNGNLNFYIAGVPSMQVLLSANMQKDLIVLIPFVIIVLLISLFISFKRLSGILLPMITVFISTAWTIGLMGLLNVPLSILGIIIPVLMMAVGSAYGIHVVSHYYDDIRDFKGELTKSEHDKIILKSLLYVKKPIFLAGLTTVAGFGSLSFSSIIPMRNFGIFTSVGIVFALVVALTLIPALLVFNYNSASKKKEKNSESVEDGAMERGFSFYYDAFGKRKYLILFFSIVVLILSGIGAKRMIIDNSFIEYFKDSTDIRVADKFLREKFAGTTTFDVIISGEDVGIDPELLKAMDDFSIFINNKYEEVTKVVSFTDTVKRMNQVMHVDSEEEADFYSDETYSDSSDSGFTDDGFGDFWGDSSETATDDGFGDLWGDSSETAADDGFADLFGDDIVETSSEPEVVNTYNPTVYNKDITGNDFMELLANAYARSQTADISAKELINLLKKETNYKGYDFFEVPFDPAKYGHDELSDLSNLLSQYFAMTGLLEGFTGENDDPLSPDNIKMTVMMNTTGTRFTSEIIPVAQKYINDNFPDKGYDIYITGTALAQEAITDLVTKSSIMSVLISLVIVFIIISIAYKSAVAGIFGMIPLGFTVLFNYGLMGLTGIKLDMSTAMVGSIAIGIGIDYTIHFMASYHKFSQTLDCGDEVTKRSLMSSGKAIIFNALSVAAGFIVLLRSNFNPLMYLGLLISITMLIASIASMTIMPALFNIFKPKFIKK